MKKATILFFTILLTLALVPGAWASTEPVSKAVFKVGSVKYTVNNTEYSMDAVSFIRNGRTYVPVRYLAYSCGLEDSGIEWDLETKTVTFTQVSDRVVSLKLKVGDPHLLISESTGKDDKQVKSETRQMDVTPLLIKDRVYLPARYVAEAFGFEIMYDGNSQTVTIYSTAQNSGDEYVPLSVLKSISANVENDTTVITIQSEKDPLNYNAFSLYNPDRLVIDLTGTAPGQVPQSMGVSSPLVEGIRVGWYGKNPDITRVVVDLKDKVRYSLTSLDNSRQLRIVLRQRSHSLPGSVIVLDPGHGGSDPGAIGPSGLREKDVNLAIAQKTAEYLRKQGATVILTRTADTYVGLTDRPNVANQNGADLFLSIHCNSFSNNAANGTSTYHLRSQLEGMDEVRNRGIALAKSIQTALINTLNRTNRGVLQADFVVLTKSKVPAALAEIAFISNPEEERLLGDAVFQDRTAQALARGIADFFTNW